MSNLDDRDWPPHFSPDTAHLVKDFYVPALSCAIRYDRTTGYFTAPALALAMRGLEYLVVNKGRMRLLVGCTLAEGEVEAIEKGENLRDTLEAQLLRMPLVAPDPSAAEALELLAWMVAQGFLEVKVAVPCNAARKPVPGVGLFHAKAGIIEDRVGNVLAFTGSINETEAAWRHNYETFHVFTSWTGTKANVAAEERTFQTLWADQSSRAIVMDIPSAKAQELMAFLPKDDKPARLKDLELDDPEPVPEPDPVAPAPEPEPRVTDPRRVVWSFLRQAPQLPDLGDRVGEATSAITPWPHQVRAFERMYNSWPPRLLIADEVGLGKTIQAGLLLRQAWLSGRAKRILVMAPKAVLNQWQIELREKFNLNWPIYDGNKFAWRPCPVLGANPVKAVSRHDWHQEPFVIVSSHLMRRADRARELLEAEPWDLVVLDEAHHARRRSGGIGDDERPNQLLRLMKGLERRTQGLVLLTATPMQVSPVEVWDLLALLGLPPEWHVDAFLRFFELAGKPSPSHEELATLARLFRASEARFGPIAVDEAQRIIGTPSSLRAKKLLKALREKSTLPLKALETTDRKDLLKLLRGTTPVKRLISRHTRSLLRAYHKAGKLKTPIADRKVEDVFVELTQAEARVYTAVEEYIGSTYDNAAKEKKTAVGFVMTVYRRRLASSFHALAQTLTNRKAALQLGPQGSLFDAKHLDEDLPDDEADDEVMDADDAAQLETEALALEERGDIESLLREVRRLPADTKARELLKTIMELKVAGYEQVIVFTQYTDTLDFLRDYLIKESAFTVMCFSGRGGEVRSSDGHWLQISRDKTKAMFRDKAAHVLLCTDAAAEGLNFQFCGALVNYDMPWNPMKVEQRIGRIDRLGQQNPIIRIVNLHYKGTVEADVYMALRERIDLFTTFVGGLQPILSKLPKVIGGIALAGGEDRGRQAAALVDSVRQEVDEVQRDGGFDIDEVTAAEVEERPRVSAAYGLSELGKILEREDLLPPGDEVKKTGKKDFGYLSPGMVEAVRVTTDPVLFEQHADSLELWSPGSPSFPDMSVFDLEKNVTVDEFHETLTQQS
ncbi:DEAD/DEAH box helicase [Caenispirillum salinarum]|uniref:DEAD/DEAH box helicase n=1 Tax=Caenispirillum salinarum TaxID=859058 RepID=UPI00384F11F2